MELGRGLEISVKIDPLNIDLFNKILEGYDNLCVVTAVKPELGELVVRLTTDSIKDLIKVIKHLPFPVEILE